MEYCFSIAVGVEPHEKSNAVLGAIVKAISDAGYPYMNVKEIAAHEHWNRTAQQPTAKAKNADDSTSGV